MAVECAYSFRDLYQAAFGRPASNKQMEDLYSLDQQVRNLKVLEWAAAAGWQTRERKGADGRKYVAFAPKF